MFLGLGLEGGGGLAGGSRADKGAGRPAVPSESRRSDTLSRPADRLFRTTGAGGRKCQALPFGISSRDVISPAHSPAGVRLPSFCSWTFPPAWCRSRGQSWG